MLKKLICLMLPLACVACGFADEAAKGKPIDPPKDAPIIDNFYDPDKVIDAPIPHVSDAQ
ncbi:MAG TPA: hypothetical protein VLG76_01675 [Rhabdochlamydiaceae bacterium]|nr:hypothetical protein [Rhabdochlamydiaceae bacterium]